MAEKEYNISKNCLNCPNILLGTEAINDHEVQRDNLIELAVSGGLQRDKHTTLASLIDLDPEAMSNLGLTPDKLLEDILRAASKEMEARNIEVARIKANMAALSIGCPGLFTMVGESGHYIYTVTICRSPLAGEDGIQSAFVRREVI